MPTFRPRPLTCALGLALITTTAHAAPASAPQRVLVYSGGFDALAQSPGIGRAGYALVQRPLAVTSDALTLDDLPQSLDPSTLRLGGDGIRVRSQRYDFAGLDQAQLLQRAIGRSITVEQITPGGVRAFTGTLVAVGQGLTLRDADGGLRVLSGYSGFTLADAPEGLVARPTLRIALEGAGARSAQLDYATAGLAWRAEYRADLRLDGDRCAMRLEGHAMLVNRTGVDFDAVALGLVAGEPNRRIDNIEVSGTAVRTMAAPMEAKAMMDGAAPAPSASGEAYRYSLAGTHTLPDGSLQRLPLLDAAPAVPCERRYEAARNDGDWMPERPLVQRDLGSDGEVPVRTTLGFRNARSGGLGVPLPAGRLRTFVDGELLGEADLAHTAAGREVSLDLGQPFDLSAERRSVAFALDRSARTITETIEWTLRNAKAGPASVLVHDRLPRWSDWTLIEGGERFIKKDAQRIDAEARVPAGGETKLRYTVRYRWADDVTID